MVESSISSSSCSFLVITVVSKTVDGWTVLSPRRSVVAASFCFLYSIIQLIRVLVDGARDLVGSAALFTTLGASLAKKSVSSLLGLRKVKLYSTLYAQT